MKITWYYWSQSYPFVCTKCGSFLWEKRKICENCGGWDTMRKTTKKDYKAEMKKRKENKK